MYNALYIYFGAGTPQLYFVADSTIENYKNTRQGAR